MVGIPAHRWLSGLSHSFLALADKRTEQIAFVMVLLPPWPAVGTVKGQTSAKPQFRTVINIMLKEGKDSSDKYMTLQTSTDGK